MRTALLLVVPLFLSKALGLPQSLDERESIQGTNNLSAPFDPSRHERFTISRRLVADNPYPRVYVLHTYLTYLAYLWPRPGHEMFNNPGRHADDVLENWNMILEYFTPARLTCEEIFDAAIIALKTGFPFKEPGLTIPVYQWGFSTRSPSETRVATVSVIHYTDVSSNSTQPRKDIDVQAGRRYRLLVTALGVPMAQGDPMLAITDFLREEVWSRDSRRALHEVYNAHDSRSGHNYGNFRFEIDFETLNQRGIQSTFADLEAALRQLLLEDVISTNPQTFRASVHLVNDRGTRFVKPFIKISMDSIRGTQVAGSGNTTTGIINVNVQPARVS